MIIVLSCFDLFAVVTNHSGMLFHIISWLRGICNCSFTEWMGIYVDISGTFLILSHLALLVMTDTERYLGAYHPIFHRTSVTRRRLLTLLAILLFPITVLRIISRNSLAISGAMLLLIFLALFLPPFIFVNFK